MPENPRILNIECSEQSVTIDFCYINNYGPNAYATINSEAYIKAVGSDEKYILLEAENIAIDPHRTFFKKNGDALYYSLIFPPIPITVNEIDIIEDENIENGFNFYQVSTSNNYIKMTENTSNILRKIEKIALELRGDRKTTKSFPEEISRLNVPLDELSKFLNLNKEESAIFTIILYLSVTNDQFCLAELKQLCNFSAFDYFEIKNIIKSIAKKGYIRNLGARGNIRGNKRYEEKVFEIPEDIINSLHKNESPNIKLKDPDVYFVTDLLHSCMRQHVNAFSDYEEMQITIKEYEEEYAEINPFKISNELGLNTLEKTVLYYLTTKTLIGEEIIDVDTMLSHFFKTYAEKMMVKRILSRGDSQLIKLKYIEFVKEDFKTDKLLKLTEEGIKKIFGEDACLLNKNDGFSSGLCKLISYDSITEKNLYYNENEKLSVNTISEFLKTEKFEEIVRRLEENKMRSGLTILLHGYPGTGKTETIYQLARQTKRNILLVNISEIRDKWVGESEKRLKNVFETYRNSLKHFDQVPILLFNESDAIIGKRISVNTSVDQMNNAMQNILLQEMEDFNGILMATTNLTTNLDEAFERRFLFKIKYAKPCKEAKIAIWRNKLNFINEWEAERLAEEFEFSGGQIENISRKIYLDNILFGKVYTLDEIIKCCYDEQMIIKNSNVIGFKKESHYE